MNLLENKIISRIIIMATTLLVWSLSFSIGFLNDDFQIIQYSNPESFFDCFAPLWQQDVSVYFWRPIPNILHSLTLYFIGFEAWAFHFTNTVIYLLCCLALKDFLDTIGIDKKWATISTIIFAVLPSHELFLAWIASRGDTLAMLFILYSYTSLHKGVEKNSKLHYIISGVLYLFALMSKELAFSAAILPLLLWIIKAENKKIAIKATLFALGILFSTLLYRYFAIDANPFDAPNASNPSVFTIIKNIFIYIPLSVLPPREIEYIIHGKENIFMNARIFWIPLILLLSTLLLSLKTWKKIDFRKVAAGIFFFVIFIIPVSTMLMRWYFLLASVGLVIIFAARMEVKQSKWLEWTKRSAVFLCIMIFSFSSYKSLYSWISASSSLSIISRERPTHKMGFSEIETKSKEIYIWPAIDKINRVNTMKIGFEQMIEYFVNDTSINVHAPLRIEQENIACSEEFISLSDSSFVIESTRSRFLLQGGKSTAVFREEKFEQITDDYEIYIQNSADGNSKAKVIIKNRSILTSSYVIICNKLYKMPEKSFRVTVFY